MQNPSCFLYHDTQVGTFFFIILEAETECSDPIFLSIVSFSILKACSPLKQVARFYLATLFQSNHGIRYNSSYPTPNLPTWVPQHSSSFSLERTSYLFTICMTSRTFLLVGGINFYWTIYNVCPILFSYHLCF